MGGKVRMDLEGVGRWGKHELNILYGIFKELIET